jgi:hypothetical protein
MVKVSLTPLLTELPGDPPDTKAPTQKQQTQQQPLTFW